MKRTPTKKGSAKDGIERRKRPRKTAPRRTSLKNPRSAKASPTSLPHKKVEQELCYHCSKDLSGPERALFVEEELGRIFCSENCIANFFTPEIERLEKEYFRRVSSSDLTSEEKEAYAHFRWITLQEPDEVWCEKTLTGDNRYTLISEFQPGNKRVWCICICLLLRGEPSFLYLAFTSKNAAMVNQYRKGERVQWVRPENADSSKKSNENESGPESNSKESRGDRLADAWTDDETFMAQLVQERSADDISADEFSLYQSCLEETLQEPDEVWSFKTGSSLSPKLYHFIRYYPDENPGVWYVIVAREADDEEQIEILDAFPTRDSSFVDRYRRGDQEVGAKDHRPLSRVVH